MSLSLSEWQLKHAMKMKEYESDSPSLSIFIVPENESESLIERNLDQTANNPAPLLRSTLSIFPTLNTKP
jgi:presenilin-like A22 family membrane protease